eukprot:gene6823-biopygen5973
MEVRRDLWGLGGAAPLRIAASPAWTARPAGAPRGLGVARAFRWIPGADSGAERQRPAPAPPPSGARFGRADGADGGESLAWLCSGGLGAPKSWHGTAQVKRKRSPGACDAEGSRFRHTMFGRDIATRTGFADAPARVASRVPASQLAPRAGCGEGRGPIFPQRCRATPRPCKMSSGRPRAGGTAAAPPAQVPASSRHSLRSTAAATPPPPAPAPRGGCFKTQRFFFSSAVSGR